MTTRLSLRRLGRTLALLALSPCLYAQSITVDFDDVGAPGAFDKIVPGFDNGPHLEYPHLVLEGGVILSDVLFGSGSTSPINICATCDTCKLGDGSGLPGEIQGAFDADVSRVEIDVLNGSTAQPGSFTLTAFDPAGTPLASDTVICGPLGSGTFVQHLALQASGIRSFTVTTDLPAGYTFGTDTLVFELEKLGTSYCTSAPNSTGRAAELRATGSPRIADNDLHLLCEHVPAGQPGIFYYGGAKANVPFGNGTRCVAAGSAGLFRLPVTFASAEERLELVPDLTDPPNSVGQVTAGSTWYYQAWFRDPAAGGSTFDFSQGLALTFQP